MCYSSAKCMTVSCMGIKENERELQNKSSAANMDDGLDQPRGEGSFTLKRTFVLYRMKDSHKDESSQSWTPLREGKQWTSQHKAISLCTNMQPYPPCPGLLLSLTSSKEGTADYSNRVYNASLGAQISLNENFCLNQSIWKWLLTTYGMKHLEGLLQLITLNLEERHWRQNNYHCGARLEWWVTGIRTKRERDNWMHVHQVAPSTSQYVYIQV